MPPTPDPDPQPDPAPATTPSPSTTLAPTPAPAAHPDLQRAADEARATGNPRAVLTYLRLRREGAD